MAKERDGRPSIVIVDDNPDFLQVVKDWLEPEYDVALLPDGRGLMERLEAIRPDLLILDVGLPDVDGIELCRRIVLKRGFQTMPVLILTGRGADEDYVRSIASGGSSTMTKPVSRGELLASIEGFLAAGVSQAW